MPSRLSTGTFVEYHACFSLTVRAELGVALFSAACPMYMCHHAGVSSLFFCLQHCAYAASDACVMSRNRLGYATALLILCRFASVLGVFVNFEVQLAISDDQFSPFGTIYGDVEENPLLFSKLIWDRPEYSEGQQKDFAALVEQNGFVRLRAPTNAQQPASTFVQAAARARCLAPAAVDEQIYLHLSPGGYITALEYRVSCREQPSKLPADWSQPQQIPVVCRFPETAEPLRQKATPGLEPGGLPKATTLFPEDSGSEQGPDGEPGKKMPKKDERSWLQKNWIFLIPAGMLLMNLLTGAQEQQPAARSGQAASSGTAQPAAASTARPASSGSARSRRQR